jgi:hypothetical protein
MTTDGGYTSSSFKKLKQELRRQGGNSRKTGMSEAFISTADRVGELNVSHRGDRFVGENRERETLDKTSSDV